ncbi:5-deoxy-glucuronate isomerase [Dyella nitratireducens]|uniref:5-deoxy-glucuronate isomerase n=1 Tax=Dyella nitratireducens TaxID=1849580 RepID=A0ABQ1FSZ6_9GAMM|nr:5-deoxy-glucuronate isomerase [Dyella nitratireducens]GGA26565.1 5-deoxy-glucuronate isomerase [Dyella nitratireducens]GLQ43533.1 5-deoxy-glucuronate isomerase [Dyella nitratireducens]
MSLLVKSHPQGREIVKVTPASAGWKHVGFEAFRLSPKERLQITLPADREACLVVLTGDASVHANSEAFDNLGGRSSVFDERSPDAVYAPPGTVFDVTAHGSVELALATAPATGKHPVRLIPGTSMKRSVRGKDTNTRYICDILPETEPAESLLVVEVVTPAAHSSSYPPHKHDTDALPQESALEETYYHRIDPPQGFAFQRVYTDARDLDESMAVCDHDVVMVPRGYHPVVMPHGYRGYYLNVMAGARRAWHFKNDPAHDWLMQR